MTAQKIDLTVEQGSDFRHMFSADVDGRSRSLAGWSARGAVRHSAEGGLLHDLKLSVGGGNVTLRIPGVESAGWDWQHARYEIILFGPQGQRERLARGQLTVDQSLVRE